MTEQISVFHPDGPTLLELTRQALSSTERGYDLLAPKFDVTPFRTPDELLEAARPLIGGPRSVDAALDLCCGTGAAMGMLRPLCRDRVVGVDFSRGMLEEARRRLATSEGEAEIELVHGDVLDLDYDGELDVVTTFGSCGHFLRRDQPRLVAKVARALRPGGRFVFAGADPPPLWSRRLWLATGFNAVMAVRNVLWRPHFVMYYLSFLIPTARRLLEEHGFTVEIRRGFCASYPSIHLVIATWGCEGTGGKGEQHVVQASASLSSENRARAE